MSVGGGEAVTLCQHLDGRPRLFYFSFFAPGSSARDPIGELPDVSTSHRQGRVAHGKVRDGQEQRRGRS